MAWAVEGGWESVGGEAREERSESKLGMAGQGET